MSRLQWRKAIALRPADRRAIFEACALLVVFRVGLFFVSFPMLRRFADRWAAPAGRDRSGAGVPKDRIVWAITAVASRVRGTTCLVEALAADAMLRRHGHRATLKVGVRRGVSLFEAHAWVESDGSVVMGAHRGLDEYSVLS